ncbi:unnamed protein product [Coregonus sp. 'balchen']|nr:unnamed protein product [Coregonus sp. 'balchen']
MAAPGKHVGYYIYKNGRFFLSNFEQFWLRRNFGWSAAVCQQNASTERESAEAIVIPKKKTWSKGAVLQALASTVNRKLYSLSQESGRMAANHIVNKNPKFFQKDFAEPHIPCLMPETMELRIEEVSTTVSTDASNDLLDLICLYGDRDPMQDDKPETEDVAQEAQEEGRRRKGRLRRASDLVRIVWRENNNAERIFNLLPERDTRAYSALIRGMVKYGAHVKAFNAYTDMLNNRLIADVHTFNALISAAPEVREKYNEKWDLVVDLLKQMNEQKVKPNLLTFNAVLKALRRCGSLARAQSLHTLSEMKAMGIAPSLASFDHVLGIFYKAASPSQGQTDILHEVMTEVAGRTFVAQDPDDVNFFSSAMRICLDTKDIEAAYRVHDLLSVGENWRLLGDSFQQSIYYGRLFNLLCMMEHIDVVLKRMGHDNKSDLVDELLSLMARDKHSPEGQGTRMALEWTATAMTNITSILLAAQKKQQAWDMLKLFKTKNRVPSEELMEEFLASSNDPQQALELVQISASFCLPTTPKLAERVLQEFELSEEQKTILSELEVSTEVSE